MLMNCLLLWGGGVGGGGGGVITILLEASTWEAAGRINHNSVHSDGQ